MIRVGVNGYGTIGKRVADAVNAQPDMELIGVAKTQPNFEAHTAGERGYPMYAAIPERSPLFSEAGVELAGEILSTLSCDVVDAVSEVDEESIGNEGLAPSVDGEKSAHGCCPPSPSGCRGRRQQDASECGHRRETSSRRQSAESLLVAPTRSRTRYPM